MDDKIEDSVRVAMGVAMGVALRVAMGVQKFKNIWKTNLGRFLKIFENQLFLKISFFNY